ncbi:MAG: PEP/pyruvate-binding domain-containing protein [Bacillota bacterium]
MTTMEISAFQDIRKATQAEVHYMGGKAATLSLLQQKGFPVPPGSVVFQEPQSEEEFAPLLEWWNKMGSFPVAVRSSASGEDSGDFSYAGQFVTLLHVQSAEDLKTAVKTCFQAVHRTASKTYASHFDQPQIPMHVLVQRMIDSQYSGVFFSVDPRRSESSWLVEVVEGQGEQLVSGQVTPFRFDQNGSSTTPKNWRPEYLQTIVQWGLKVEQEFGYKVDMEWAIDQEGTFWILQSRPITAQGAPSNNRKILDQEWQRLSEQFSLDTSWDGHTFAEWTGLPSELTFDLWQRTFNENQAFDLALKFIGYEGLGHESKKCHLLDRIYGRAYLNLKSLEPVYFGKSPYRIEPHPRPHLEFAWNKLTLGTLARAPHGIFKMAQVAWKIQTDRQDIANKALQLAKSSSQSDKDAFALKAECENGSLELQQQKLKSLCDSFTSTVMQSTFLLTLLIESTTQGILALIEKDLGKKDSSDSLQLLTGTSVQTLASEMNLELKNVQDSEEKWHSFLSRYGHRGVGELELSHPRWIETKQPPFKGGSANPLLKKTNDLFDQILVKISSLRRPIFKQEFAELQKLLQIREDIKMEVMKPYAQIRWLALNIGSQTGLGNDIFWLKRDEILSLTWNQDVSALRSLILDRKQKAQCLKAVDLPMIFSLSDLKNVLTEDPGTPSTETLTKGVSLASGIAHGIVHIVNNPEEEILDSWPDNYILVAEATDPGWTPLFEKAKGVVVARGGVLSHCAIVAREMGLPAVGEIRGASHLFKEGEHVWIDGNHGTVRRGN